MKKILLIIFCIFCFSLFSGSLNCFAYGFGNINGFTEESAGQAGLESQTDVPTLIANIIKAILGFIGVVFVILIIYGGATWLVSGGEEAKIAKAKKIITYAIIGVIIILGAYTITNFVVTTMEGASTTTAPATPATPATP